MQQQKRSIEDRFTLPECRKACRSTDVAVSPEEYRRLRDLESGEAQYTYVEIEQVIGDTRRRCKVLVVKKDTPGGDMVEPDVGWSKAMSISSLSEYDLEAGFRRRIVQIGRPVADAIINEFKKVYSINTFVTGEAINEENPLLNISVQGKLKMGRSGDFDFDFDKSPSPSNNMRKNFLYELQLFIEREVNRQIKGIFHMQFNGESIWDKWSIKVNIRYSEDDRVIDAKAFFVESAQKTDK